MAGKPLRVLLIQSWVIRGVEIREAFVVAGYRAHLYRVDFESALAAALMRGGFDVVVLDTKTTGITRSTAEALMREHGVSVPLVEIAPDRSLGEDVRMALSALRN